MIPSHKFTCRFAALAAPLALLTSTTFFPTTSAKASKPQRSERAAPVATVTAATSRGADTTTQPVDPPGHQGEPILEAARQIVERLISNHKDLQTRASSLTADLESEKARVKELLSERDQALVKVKESAARIAELEARWRAAQDALVVERKRHKIMEQRQEQALSSLRSALSTMGEKRDALNGQLDDLVGQTKPAPEAQTAAAPKASQTPPIIPTARSQPVELGQNAPRRVTSLDRTQRSQPVDEEVQQKLKNANKDRIESFLSQHRPTLQKAQHSLGSVDPDITEVRSRLMNAKAAIDSMTLPPISEQDTEPQTTASVGELAARIDEMEKEISDNGAMLNGLSLETGAIAKAFESIQEQARRLKDEQQRVTSEASEFKETEEHLNRRFDDVRKKTLELETAAELLRIRQVLSDFTMGRIGRGALAQHVAALQKTATNLDVLANELAKANRSRDRLVIRGDSLRGQVALFGSNLNQVTDAVADLSTRLDAWLERAGSAHTPPLDDLVAVLQEIKQGAHQHAAAGLALQARAERLNETLKATETDVSAVSATLADRQNSLHEQIERLRRLEADAAGRRLEPLPHNGVTATEPGPPLAACGPSSKEPQGDNTSVAGTQATDCQEIDRFLKDVGHVRAALAARLRQTTKLLETAEGLKNDLRVREAAIARMGRDVAQANRSHQDETDRVDHLGGNIASLSEQQSAHEQRLLEQSNKIATFREQLIALTKLVEAARDAQIYAPNPTAVSAAEDLEVQALSNRLENISVRVDTLEAAIAALKRPPPPPTRPGPPAAIRSPERDNGEPRVTESKNATEIGVRCNQALPSCRRWLYLREQRALKANPGADDHVDQNQLDRP